MCGDGCMPKAGPTVGHTARSAVGLWLTTSQFYTVLNIFRECKVSLISLHKIPFKVYCFFW